MTSFVTAISDPVAPLVGIAIFASVLVALGAVIGFSRAGSKRKQVANLLSRYGRVRGAGEVATLEKHVRQTRFSKAVRAYVDSVDEKFISASLRPSMLFWVLLQTSPAVLVFLISLALFRSAAFAAILALLCGYLIPRWFLKSRAQKRAVKFNDELPQVLQVLASALRSGLTLPQALKVVAEHDKTEVGVQFTQALTEVDYGADLQDALLRVAERMKSRDLKWLVAALEIQREVGGSLSGILDTVAATIRGRRRGR
jgi:tight adherence protein B